MKIKTTVISRRMLDEKFTRAATFCLFALVAVLCQAAESKAQWTAPDAQGNISSTNAGNVGIGTNAPASLLDISGSTGIRLRTNGTSPGFSFFDRSTVPGDQVVFQGNTGNYSLFNVSTKGANVGTERASGMAFWTVDIANTANATQFQFQYTPTFGPVFFTQKFGTGAQGDKKISFQTAWQTTTNAPTQLVLDTTGNVGVGTSAPIRGLQISGANYTAAAELAIANTGMPAAHRNFSFWGDSTAGAAGRWYIRSLNETGSVNGRDFLTFDNASGSVAIGTARGDNLYNFRLVLADNTAGSGASNFLNLSNYVDADMNFKVTQVGAAAKYALISPSPANVPLALSTNAGGRVGIGTTAPATALHVVGDITVTGNINAKYQDVAEWVPTTQKLSVGTVVVIDAKGSNQVLASAAAYDTSVAGVVSAQPGISLGERGEGKALVATTGRVKVKVDASKAPIRAGDLLVTSDTPGVAMKSEPITVGGRRIHAPGTIIGKALEPLEKGTGEILVLLSLQ